MNKLQIVTTPNNLPKRKKKTTKIIYNVTYLPKFVQTGTTQTVTIQTVTTETVTTHIVAT